MGIVSMTSAWGCASVVTLIGIATGVNMVSVNMVSVNMVSVNMVSVNMISVNMVSVNMVSVNRNLSICQEQCKIYIFRFSSVTRGNFSNHVITLFTSMICLHL